MKCPYCEHLDNRVIDSRLNAGEYAHPQSEPRQIQAGGQGAVSRIMLRNTYPIEPGAAGN